MFQRAVDLGLPASFVELRHEATHRELPSLVVLRNAAQRSLEWLWDYYWVKVESESGSGLVAEDENAVKKSVRGCLAQITGEGEPMRKKRKGLKLLASVSEELGSVCKTSTCGRRALARVLIDERVLVPERRYVFSWLSMGIVANFDQARGVD